MTTPTDLIAQAEARIAERYRDERPHFSVRDADLFTALIARIRELEGERDGLKRTYEDIYEEAMSDAESDAQDFESDLWKRVRSLLDDLGFDWSGDVQFDGVTADDAVQFLRDALDWETSHAEAAETKLAEAVKMLDERDREYNRKTNDLIERHAAKLAEVEKERDATSRALQIQAKADSAMLKGMTADLEQAKATVATLAAQVEAMRDQLRLIELLGYREGEQLGWLVAHMRGVANDALEGRTSAHIWRLFPQHRPAALTTEKTNG